MRLGGTAPEPTHSGMASRRAGRPLPFITDVQNGVPGSVGHPLGPEEMAAGALDGFDVVLFPGGMASHQFDALGAIPDDLEGMVDYPRSVEGVEVGLLFRQIPRKGIKVSFRSNGAVNVNALARRFGGGGHVRAAGALIEGPMDQVRHDVTRATREAVELSRSGH